MGPYQTTVLIVFILIILGSAAYIINHFEQQRALQRQLTSALKQEVRQASHLLTHFPPQLMTSELYLFLLQFIHLQWKKLYSVVPSEENQKGLAAVEQRLQNRFQPEGFRDGALTVMHDRNQAMFSAAIIRELAQWLKIKSKKRTASSETLRDLLSYSRYCYEQVAIDAMIFDAIDSESLRSPQVAYHQYKSCLIALSKLDRGILVDAQMHSLKLHMQKIAPHEEEPEPVEQDESSEPKSPE